MRVAIAGAGNVGFGFNASDIRGFPSGSVFLTGGGSFNPSTGAAHSAGGFRCTTAVQQGPLNGCAEGEGVRWDTVALVSGTDLKCSVDGPVSHANTDGHTAVLVVRRAGVEL